MRIAILAAALLAAPIGLAAPLPAAAQQQAVDLAMTQALAHSRRDEDRARDVYRHPAETLAFFQVRPGMTVVDYMPAGGWFSRVIIPYLGEQGTYIALDPELHPSMTGYWDTYRNTAERFPGEARGWVGDEGARVLGANTDTVPDSSLINASRWSSRSLGGWPLCWNATEISPLSLAIPCASVVISCASTLSRPLTSADMSRMRAS